MTKERRGLGRGLNSLLGGSERPTTPTPSKPSQKERITVNAVESEKNLSQQQTAPKTKPSQPVNTDDATFSASPTNKKSPEQIDTKESYISESENDIDRGDGVMIKSVSARVPTSEASDTNKIADNQVSVSIDCVKPNPNQPRTNLKKEELEELSQSIKKDGLLQPILVRPLGENTYQIIAGERRWQACKNLGMTTIPIRIKEVDDDRAIELALVENIQRSDLNPIEEAYGYRRMMETQNLTQSEVAQAVSKGRSTIANALRLLELPEDAQQLLFEEKITAGHARAILSIPTAEGRKSITKKLISEKLSVREVEALARLMSNISTGEAHKRKPTPSSFKKVARALREKFKTNVRVKTVRGKNKIEIEFADDDELERIFKAITE